MKDQGPVADWLAGLLDGLWKMVLQIVAEIVTGAKLVEAKIAGIESEIKWGFVALCVLIIVHAYLTRKT